MKKSIFLLGLLSITSLCLAACGNSKNYTMTFDKAYDIANHSALQDMLISSENFQQGLNLSTNIDNGANKMALNLQSDSKHNLGNQKSESTTTFTLNVNADDTSVLIDGALDIKIIDNTIYLNLGSLNFSGPEDTSFLAAMVEGFKGQRFSIPMSGMNEMPNSFSYVKDAKKLNEQAKEMVINEGSVIYNGKFAQFDGYNAWRFSLDSEKLQALINDYYARVNASLDEETQQEAPQLNIQNFEGYLVITGKNKVTTVIENMDMIEGETDININGFGGDDYEINASSNGESILTLKAVKKNSNYNISLNAADSILLEGIITPKLSTSKIDIKFDATLTIKSDYEESDDTILPIKGNRTYTPLSEFNVTTPEGAQDLTQLLAAYLGNAFGSGEYLENYEDNQEGEYAFTEELNETIEENIETVEA